MPHFEVQGVDSSGKNVKVLIESDSVKGARQKARGQGVTPTSVVSTEMKSGSGSSAGAAQAAIGFSNPFQKISAFDVSNMTRQLATLVKAHVPVVESLTALIEQIDNPKLKKILIGVRQQVNEGRGLADGFSLYPAVFSKVFINMVRAGESSGRLDVVLMRLADLSEGQVKLNAKVSGALTYPIIMVVVAFIVLGVILVKVVPQITKIFSDMKQTLPLPTRILMAASQFAQDYLMVLVFGILIVAVLLERYIKTAAGRARKDAFFLKFPIVGNLMQQIVVARFGRTLGTLLSSGVPMLVSLQITRNVVDHAVFEDVIDQCGTQVSEGRPLAYALKQSRRFPPIVIHMIGVGEKTGELEPMLLNVAETYEQQVDTTLGSLTSVLEPVMMIVMALFVGAIVMAVLMPIFEMNQFG